MCFDDYDKINDSLVLDIFEYLYDYCSDKIFLYYSIEGVTFRTTNMIGDSQLNIVASINDCDFRIERTLHGNSFNISDGGLVFKKMSEECPNIDHIRFFNSFLKPSFIEFEGGSFIIKDFSLDVSYVKEKRSSHIVAVCRVNNADDLINKVILLSNFCQNLYYGYKNTLSFERANA